MAPPNAEPVMPVVEAESKKIDLKQLAREKGRYLVYPETKYPEIEEFEHHDPGHRADPKKASLYDNAEKIFDLTPAIGTEIHGIQLSRLTDQQKDDLALMVAERGVVFFRKQDIDVHQAVDLGKHYGPLHPTFGVPSPDLPFVHVLYYDTSMKKRDFDYRRGWHTDVSYEKHTPGLTMLKLDTIPSCGGDTLWCSGTALYDRLSPQMQRVVEGLEAVHSGQDQVDEAIRLGRTVRRDSYTAVHPLVRTHPVTGRNALFVQPRYTRSIVGLDQDESDCILNSLFNHIISGYDIQVRFKWEEDSVAVWDNRVTIHNPIFDYFGVGKRHGFRITSLAERPFLGKHTKTKSKGKLRENEDPCKFN
ncbi:hypothetical protein BDB00DRAFT_757424 [Zychaea mexicana]|uniref:uncharacterized protein n=1 Tax=Zychaea mexicana TaxID=64656 RepID=UPI0022FDC1BB|nr:uncharacterized protein BDB00DRAFT_757424 [Zychaea mexicana]KAI9496984.1 hypothetical protein BDB00DRAFT_757424 [Zychaea mexicana]